MTTSRHSVEQEEVMAYLDGELAVDRAAAAAAHLERCHECQALAADLKNLSRRMMEWEVEASDPRVLASASAALDEPGNRAEESQSPKFTLRGLVTAKRLWATATASLIAVVAFAFLISGPRQITAPAGRATLEAVHLDTNGSPAPAPKAKPADRYFSNGSASQVITDGKLQDYARIAPGVLGGRSQNSEEGDQVSPEAFTPQGPMIIRTAALTVVTQQKDFDSARSAMDDILKRHHGYFGELTAAAPQNGGRSIKATLRVPANELDGTLAELKKLGRVESETQGGEEVTSEYIDLEARLANARHTEQRLAQIQAQRTGKLADVLKVEVEIARVRGEIEQMEAQRKSMRKQVDFATIDATLNEEYKAPLQSVAAPSTSTQFHNAFVEGYRNVADGVIALLLFLISYGPTLLLWGAVLFFIGRFVWKKVRRTTAS